jgi:type IV pilus assembly protein PilN
MRFTINLATRTYLDSRLVNRVCAGAMLLLLALLAWNVGRVAGNIGELRRLRAESAAFETRLNSRPAGVSEKEFTRLLASIRFYNDVIDRKAYNWMGLLERVENATPEGIALVTLTPGKNGKELKIEGRAKGFGNVRAYVERLNDSREFTDILLLSHRELVSGEKSRGVQFLISCRAVTR